MSSLVVCSRVSRSPTAESGVLSGVSLGCSSNRAELGAIDCSCRVEFDVASPPLIACKVIYSPHF
jgi:hypothetical protein